MKLLIVLLLGLLIINGVWTHQQIGLLKDRIEAIELDVAVSKVDIPQVYRMVKFIPDSTLDFVRFGDPLYWDEIGDGYSVRSYREKKENYFAGIAYANKEENRWFIRVW